MKIHLFILPLSILLFQSCDWGNNSKQNSQQQNESHDSIQVHSIVEIPDTSFDDATAIQMIEEFYSAYLSEMMKDDLSPQGQARLENIKKQYVSESLLDKIKNRNLDYDPFINAQDNSDNWIKTLKVSKSDSGMESYIVSFVNDYDGNTKKIFLSIKKDNNTYKIDELLTHPALDPPPANIATRQEGESLVNYGRYICDNEHIVIDIENSDSYKIYEKGKLLDSGKYTIDNEGSILYIKMNQFEAIYHNDTLDFQNVGNSMNYYHHFKSSEQKYLHFINNKIE